MAYINLNLNPEGYTGYEGADAWRIWAAIYQENCFQSALLQLALFSPGFSVSHAAWCWRRTAAGVMQNMCYEQRVFYRLISGVHSCIATHIASNYPLPSSG